MRVIDLTQPLDERTVLWPDSTPFEAPVLDLATEAGGLEPVRQVGGLQTAGLALRGADGRSYTFRSLHKEPERLLPAVDGELAGLAAAEFERRGVRLVLGADAEQVRRVNGRLTVTLSTGAGLVTDAVLVAAGRTPNTEGLGLEEAGVRLDARGRIVVDGYHRTTAPGVYAAGDVVDPGLASHAMQQGRAAAAHAWSAE